ncbi:hypothetical protein RSOLAG1IB_08731 [Rhizoctonia solani AG-1 IB]|uniref:Laminin domain protein n=1 Tax=Thanatephorus cucumeris (strain AG1-IB / isolate 7/3/14) TaxID=1108050 RepID=A0A0B7FR85_THACB|nr:hypothetical protein RSOLAG1IB_08731 [Rhizoctonia solani AG-1 IB]
MISDRDDRKIGLNSPLVPPQLPPFLASVFKLKPILGHPSREEVKLVHEAIRALNNFMHMPDPRDTDLPAELSQYLFDIQIVCYRQKYPINVLPNEVVYEPPSLPDHIPVELKSITGAPSNKEITSVHTALRIAESFSNVPSLFDPDLHAQISQHLFDVQLARHVQQSMVNRSTSSVPKTQCQTALQGDGNDTNTAPETHNSINTTPHENTGAIAMAWGPSLAQPDAPHETTSYQHLHERNDAFKLGELMVEIRDIKDSLKQLNRIMVGTQNSLARGFNSSRKYGYNGVSHDIGAHSLINDYGEVPETHHLPTFENGEYGVHFSLNKLDGGILARYLRFYGLGEELIEEGEELKIKDDMVENAKKLLSERLFLKR